MNIYCVGNTINLSSDLSALDPAITTGPYTLLINITDILNGNDMKRCLYHHLMALLNTRVRHIISTQ